jgi:hypothetical protein
MFHRWWSSNVTGKTTFHDEKFALAHSFIVGLGLTYRESLRDIEACLRSQPTKLYHMGLRGTVSRSALADANERRDWRIYAAEFAQALIRTARRLYAQDSLSVDLAETVCLGGQRIRRDRRATHASRYPGSDRRRYAAWQDAP